MEAEHTCSELIAWTGWETLLYQKYIVRRLVLEKHETAYFPSHHLNPS